jgi:hypothetical protein
MSETWQSWLERRAASLGLKETSGYRSPQQEAALGGPASSYHTRGSPDAPGALDFGGPADKLRQLFDEIKQAFAGRINELYLNVPGGESVAIKNDRYLGRNPEAGRPLHLHAALGGSDVPAGLPQPASGIPAANRGEKAAEAAPEGVECVRSFCFPTAASLLGVSEKTCYCWSDVWVYGTALLLILGGAVLVTRGKG